jgi:putative redox protein
MTVRMYARRKGWPLEHVSVDVSHDKVHAQDCADCPDKNAKIDIFQRVIRLDGPLDPDQRAALLSIADRCPVHRTMEGTIKVETVLVET